MTDFDTKPHGRILVIEDDEVDVLLLKRMIAAGAGEFEIAVCSTLGEAQQWLQQNDCDLVLLDQSLPDGIGLEGIAQVRSASTEVPIVMLTGLDDETMAEQARQAGAADYLVKGACSPKEFFETLQRVIGQSSAV